MNRWSRSVMSIPTVMSGCFRFTSFFRDSTAPASRTIFCESTSGMNPLKRRWRTANVPSGMSASARGPKSPGSTEHRYLPAE